MRLLFINYEFPPLGGGGGNANAQIASQLSQMGHEVVVLTARFKGLPNDEKKEGYRIIRIPSMRRFQEKCRIFEMVSFMFSACFYSLKLARKWRPDVSIPFFTIPSGPSAWVLKKIFRVPYIVSLRGGDVPGFMHPDLRLHHWFTEPVIRFLWKGAKGVVANSEGLKNLALKTSDDIDIMTIPNGVDTGFFNPENVKVYSSIVPVFQGAGDPVLRIMTAGRLTAQKGIDTLLFAIWRLKGRLKRPVQVWIVGDGPRRASLEQLVSDLKIEDQVFFLGWCDREMLKAFYRSADIFVLPSLDEGMPNVLLEAMAMGLPVVATQISGSQELIEEGENGFLVPSKNPVVMAQKLAQLIDNNSLRLQMARSSRNRAYQFDWSEVARDYLQLCETAV